MTTANNTGGRNFTAAFAAVTQRARPPDPVCCASRTGRATNTIARASAEERHERSAAPEPDNPDLPPDNKLTKLTDDGARALGLADVLRSRYFKFGRQGHIMRSRDKQAACAYTSVPDRPARASRSRGPRPAHRLPQRAAVDRRLQDQDADHLLSWEITLADELPRTVTDRDGRTSTVLDAVLHAVRAPEEWPAH